MLIHLETDASYENSTSHSFVPWTILIARASLPPSLVSFHMDREFRVRLDRRYPIISL